MKGPVIAARFDMDAVDVTETTDTNHRPVAEGFASVNEGMMHACGHDTHTAIGLGVARVLMEMKDSLSGTVKLIFQPGEEGVRGAKSIADSGILDDVDYILGGHIGVIEHALGKTACKMGGFFATTKLDAVFTGVPSHAAGSPEKGKNALLAAASAALSISAIPRHSGGSSRVNVGTLHAGSGRNVIPSEAVLRLETRGETSEINDYIRERTLSILEGAAQMYDVSLETRFMGSAESAFSSDDYGEYAQQTAQNLPGIDGILEDVSMGGGGSEDFTYMMRRVQDHGGKAIFMLYGTNMVSSHHNGSFDIDERTLPIAVEQVSAIILKTSSDFSS